MLKEAAEKRDSPDNILSAIESILDHGWIDILPNRSAIEPILMSMVTSNLITMKRHGNAVPQIPSTGLDSVGTERKTIGVTIGGKQKAVVSATNALKSYTVNEDGTTDPAEIITVLPKQYQKAVLAKYSKRAKRPITLFEAVEMLNEDMARDKAHPDYMEIEIFALRIPNQQMSSNDVFKVKQFYIGTKENFVYVPADIVVKVGSDFDIDKLQMYFPNMDKDFNEIRYEGGASSLSESSKTTFESTEPEILDSELDAYMEHLMQTGQVEKEDCNKAEDGAVTANFTPGGRWKTVEKLEGPSHREGGIDLQINKEGRVTFKNASGAIITAAAGLVIPGGDKDKPIRSVEVTMPTGKVENMSTSSPEYKKLYDDKKLMIHDKTTDEYTAPTMKEVEITGKATGAARDMIDTKKSYSKEQYIKEKLPAFAGSLGVTADNLGGNAEGYKRTINTKVAENILKRKPNAKEKDLTPYELEVISNSDLAYKIRANLGERFEQGILSVGNAGSPVEFKSPNLTPDQARRENTPLNILAPLEAGSKAVRKAIGDTDEPNFLKDIALDPLNLLGLGLIDDLPKLGKAAKALSKERQVVGNVENATNELRQIITPSGFKNKVFDSNVQLGDAAENAHISELGYNYRTLSQREVDAISDTGGVFPREGKQKGGNKNVKYWTKGNEKNFYGDQPNETIRVKQTNFNEDAVVKAEDVEIFNKETKQFESLASRKRNQISGNIELNLWNPFKKKTEPLPPTPVNAADELARANADALAFSQSPYNKAKLQEFRPGQNFDVTNTDALFHNSPKAREKFAKLMEENPEAYADYRNTENWLDGMEGKYTAKAFGDMEDLAVVSKSNPKNKVYNTAIHEIGHSRSVRLPATKEERIIIDDAWKGLKEKDGSSVPNLEGEAVQGELRMLLGDKLGKRVYTQKDTNEIKTALEKMIASDHPYVHNINDFDISKIIKSLNKIGLASVVPAALIIGSTTTLKDQLNKNKSK
jgi:hypothetical protein